MKRRTKAEWNALVEKYIASGLKQATWCEQQGVNLNTFRNHHSRAKKTNSPLKENNDRRSSISDDGTIKWATVTSTEQTTKNNSVGIQVQIGRYTIIVSPEFHAKTLTKVCEVLVRL